MRERHSAHETDPSLELRALRFVNETVEREFRAQDWRAVLPLSRFCYISGALLWPLFGVLDYLLARDSLTELWIIRYGFGWPTLLLAIALTFVRPTRHRLQLVGPWVIVICGGSIVAMVAVTSPPAFHSYYVGIILVLIYGYSFGQVRFPYAVAVGNALMIAYGAVSLSKSMPFAVFVNNLFFLISTVYIGSFACFILERYRRTDFVHHRVIDDERAKLVELSAELEHISIRDPLTGLYNRRHLRQRVRESLDMYHRDRNPIAALLTDLDNFKNVNDRFGHPAGDELLQRTADLMRATFRRTDLIFRYGGDEFFVLLHNTSLVEARMLAERTIDHFRELIVDNPAFSAAAGISIGVAMMNESMREPEQLLAAADRALYDAKQQGKARVAVARPSDVVTVPDRNAPPS